MLFPNYSCSGEPGISKYSRSVLGNPQYYTRLLPLPRTQCSSCTVINCRRWVPCSACTAILVALAPWRATLNNPTKLGAMAPEIFPGQKAGHTLRDFFKQLLSAAHWRLCTNLSWPNRDFSLISAFQSHSSGLRGLRNLNKSQTRKHYLERSWPSPVSTLPHDFPFIF